ncbi:MAG: PKD domain-containing protein [Rhodocyclaceae bacterium]|nr:PKD domain-containing protein [Rhodocyclaceae bacterium]
MKRIELLLSIGCLAGLPVHAATAQQVNIQSEKLCTERPPSIFVLRAESTGLTPPLHFLWDLGDGGQWNGREVPERAYEFGRYNVVLAVSDAAGRVRKASIALDVEAMGCGGI